jgi:Fe-S-cluster containining protein
VDRISEATGLPARRFVEIEWLSDDEAARYEQDRPLFAGYFRHLPRRLTLRTRGGACVFLGDRGCTLSEEVRPRACRLYPFEPGLDGSIAILPDRQGSSAAAANAPHACLAVEESESLESLLTHFGLTASELHALAGALAREVSEHARHSAPDGRYRNLGAS